MQTKQIFTNYWKTELLYLSVCLQCLPMSLNVYQCLPMSSNGQSVAVAVDTLSLLKFITSLRNNDRFLHLHCRYARYAAVTALSIVPQTLATTSAFMTCRSLAGMVGLALGTRGRRRIKPWPWPKDTTWNWHNPNPNPETGLVWTGKHFVLLDSHLVDICCHLLITEKVQVGRASVSHQLLLDGWISTIINQSLN